MPGTSLTLEEAVPNTSTPSRFKPWSNFLKMPSCTTKPHSGFRAPLETYQGMGFMECPSSLQCGNRELQRRQSQGPQMPSAKPPRSQAWTTAGMLPALV
jgi:hypothetical protein